MLLQVIYGFVDVLYIISFALQVVKGPSAIDEKLPAKLHKCSNCGIMETEPKIFKRCHKLEFT